MLAKTRSGLEAKTGIWVTHGSRRASGSVECRGYRRDISTLGVPQSGSDASGMWDQGGEPPIGEGFTLLCSPWVGRAWRGRPRARRLEGRRRGPVDRHGSGCAWSSRWRWGCRGSVRSFNSTVAIVITTGEGVCSTVSGLEGRHPVRHAPLQGHGQGERAFGLVQRVCPRT